MTARIDLPGRSGPATGPASRPAEVSPTEVRSTLARFDGACGRVDMSEGRR
ncbi:hypothetical protein FHS29_003592 [Saccharothrix tamanrassetensis]|uniref:Uncharacterized protein n=1 Tax=Saccharothrix tamanrassetensis TaxID=1051531 RepID=A0A841CI76_9PSEU|nr:hypothetical protein [Saccharothrix tamanrassetensis]MBB5956999.1 hypothetical protein [Saccharothrix tamanrassetensis]